MENKHRSPPLSMAVDPSPEAMAVDLSPEAMAVDFSPASPVAVSTGRDFSDDALSYIVETLPKHIERKHWQDDGTDTALDRILPTVYHAIAAAKEVYDGPESFLSDINQVKENTKVAKKGGSDFFHLLRKALKEDDWGRFINDSFLNS